MRNLVDKFPGENPGDFYFAFRARKPEASFIRENQEKPHGNCFAEQVLRAY